MKKILLVLSISLFLFSCSPSACECVKRYTSDGGYTSMEVGECTREFNTTGTLGESSAYESAYRNAKKECD